MIYEGERNAARHAAGSIGPSRYCGRRMMCALVFRPVRFLAAFFFFVAFFFPAFFLRVAMSTTSG